MIDLINEILATLRHNKLRTALTGFAVSWGIFLLIVLLSVSRGLVNKMEEMFSSRDNQIISITGGWAHKPYKGLKEDRQIKLKDRDLGILASQNADVVAEVSAEITGDSTVIMTSKDYLTDGYKGVYPSSQRTDGLT
ncbi:MAG: ABC transporter permease, partial [Duncaniella sp.]|nr:ABC transporter permease [Duncaniella sp.]